MGDACSPVRPTLTDYFAEVFALTLAANRRRIKTLEKVCEMTCWLGGMCAFVIPLGILRYARCGTHCNYSLPGHRRLDLCGCGFMRPDLSPIEHDGSADSPELEQVGDAWLSRFRKFRF